MHSAHSWRSRRRPEYRTVTRLQHPGGSVRSRTTCVAARLTAKQIARAWALDPTLRWPAGMVDRLAGFWPPSSSADAQPIGLPHCRAEWVRPAGIDPQRAILYLHGGGFITCGMNTHRRVTWEMSRRAEAGVLNVDYRMLPDHAITSAVDDAVDGYRWLLSEGFSADEIVVVGDSAGGYLALTAVLGLPGADLPTPAAVAAISPLTDAGPQRAPPMRGADDPLLPPAALRAFVRYVEHCHRRLSADGAPEVLASPADEDLSDAPPVAIHVGEHELLRCDAETMAMRLAEAGRPCELHVWEGQMHDFPLASTSTPEADAALSAIARFIVDSATGSRRGSGPGRRRSGQVSGPASPARPRSFDSRRSAPGHVA